jgi:tRNA A37 methylthiotransferase MiaB
MLTRMRRNHSREAYLDLIDRIRTKIPGVALSSDFICGFCDETEQEY